MKFPEYKEQILSFYKTRNWYDYNTFIRTNFLTEEVGELCQVLRKIEIGRDRPDEKTTTDADNLLHLTEELGDVLNNLIIIADKYDLDFEDIYTHNINKLTDRFTQE